MKPLQWFRVYSEIVDDVKLLTLAPSDRWFFIAILACKAQGLLDGEDAERRFRHVALKLRLDRPELEELARRLSEAELIDQVTLQPIAWDSRQFRSDHDDRDSGERVKAWREKKRNQTVTAVTPPPVTRLYPRTETETETETDKKSTALVASSGEDAPKPQQKRSIPPCPYLEIVDCYHEQLPVLPRVADLSDRRKGLISGRWRQVCSSDELDRSQGLNFFRDYFAKVGRSKFLTGKAKPTGDRAPFVADLAWLMSPENFLKVLEGRYS